MSDYLERQDLKISIQSSLPPPCGNPAAARYMQLMLRYRSIVQRHWQLALALFLLPVGGTIAYNCVQPVRYEAKGQIAIAAGNHPANLPALPPTAPANERANPTTQALILRSLPIAREAISRLKLNIAPEELLSRTSVTHLDKTNVLEISHRSRNAQQSVAIVREMMNAYRQRDLEMQRSQTTVDRRYYQDRQQVLAANLQRAETDLRVFKEQNNIFDLKAEATTVVATVDRLNQEITDGSGKLAAANKRIEEIKKYFGNRDINELIRANIGNNNFPASQGSVELQALERQLQEERTRLTDEHPTVLSLHERIAELRGKLNPIPLPSQAINNSINPPNNSNNNIEKNLLQEYANLEAERTNLEQQLAARGNTVRAYRSRMESLPKLEAKVRELERVQQLARAAYDRLQQQVQAVGNGDDQATSSAQIVSDAASTSTIVSEWHKNLLSASAIGLLLSNIGTLGWYALNRRSKNATIIKEILPYPVLGTIPPMLRRESKKTGVKSAIPRHYTLLEPYQRHPARDAFRLLLTNLRDNNAKQSLKTIAITSAVADEGKTTIAANAALSLAKTGKRVLLIDADLRSPRQHRFWGIGNEIGLTAVLAEQCQLLESVTEVEPNLEVLPAGQRVANPMAILDSHAMHELLAHVELAYDCVIIDTPALAVAADATIVGKKVAGTLIVVRPKGIDRVGLQYARGLLTQSGQNVVGIVFNEIGQQDALHLFTEDTIPSISLTNTTLTNSPTSFPSFSAYTRNNNSKISQN